MIRLQGFARLLMRHGFVLVLIVVFAFFSVFTATFLDSGNLIDMLHAMSPLLVISAGLALVVMAGKLDISVGSMAFVAASTGTLLMTQGGWSPVPALLAALLIGAGLGALNGFIVVVLRVNPLITTLGTMIAFRGVGLQLTNAEVAPTTGRRAPTRQLVSGAGVRGHAGRAGDRAGSASRASPHGVRPTTDRGRQRRGRSPPHRYPGG